MPSKTLYIFEFDNVLFRYPHHDTCGEKFMNSPDSLLPPHVDRYPDKSMWIDSVVGEFRSAMRDKHSVTALITSRRMGASDRIMDMISQKSINPDYSIFRSVSYSADKNVPHFKRVSMIKILDENPSIKEIVVWDSSRDCIDNLKDLAKRRGLPFEGNLASVK